MAACPRCARTAAVAGPRCLYCGEPLGAAALPESAPPPSVAPPARTLVVLDLGGALAAALAQTLGLSPFEATRRAERGGFHLHRICSPEAAEQERARLAGMGLRAWLLPEAGVRSAASPRLVRGGGEEDGGLVLHLDHETVRVAGGELLLLVQGAIVREYQSVARRRRVRAATVESGHRVHLHPRAPGPPLEIDPGNFEFALGPAVPGPTLLVVAGWVEALRPHVPVDDDFRRLPPALAPEAPAGGALAMVQALRPARESDAPLVLDNLAQFRFYSAWRGEVERLRRTEDR
jgi:hypothetical protein